MHIYDMFEKLTSLKSVMTWHNALLCDVCYNDTNCVTRITQVSVIDHYNISDNTILTDIMKSYTHG